MVCVYAKGSPWGAVPADSCYMCIVMSLTTVVPRHDDTNNTILQVLMFLHKRTIYKIFIKIIFKKIEIVG